jgi:hypothetical protein
MKFILQNPRLTTSPSLLLNLISETTQYSEEGWHSLGLQNFNQTTIIQWQLFSV